MKTPATETTTPAAVTAVPNGRMYRIPEVQALWGLSRVAVWRLCQSGKIRTVKFGRRCVRIPASEIERVVAGGLA